MSTQQATQQEVGGPSGGKRRLIKAALQLAARDGTTLSAVGLREMAREAGLNHNTFYRHFRNAEDLIAAAAEEISAQLMVGLKAVRQSAARHADATVGAVEYFLDFVEANPDVIIVGTRELHSLNSPMRPVLQGVLETIAKESVEQITSQNLVKLESREQLFQVSLDITRYMFSHGLDLIDHPQEREAIAAKLVAHIRRQFLGSIAVQQLETRRQRDAIST
ncbi:MAG: TetR family transcriptional regulator [Pseudomonadota bacterium]